MDSGEPADLEHGEAALLHAVDALIQDGSTIGVLADDGLIHFPTRRVDGEVQHVVDGAGNVAFLERVLGAGLRTRVLVVVVSYPIVQDDARVVATLGCVRTHGDVHFGRLPPAVWQGSDMDTARRALEPLLANGRTVYI